MPIKEPERCINLMDFFMALVYVNELTGLSRYVNELKGLWE